MNLGLSHVSQNGRVIDWAWGEQAAPLVGLAVAGGGTGHWRGTEGAYGVDESLERRRGQGRQATTGIGRRLGR